MPAVSIVTPAYNAELWLPRLIDSIVNQTLSDWEWIVVDDMSTDRTLDIAQAAALRDIRIKVIPLPCNGGVANARNLGLDAATGEYICFLDADDYWHCDKLAKQYQFMREHRETVTCMDYQRISESGVPLSKVTPPETFGFQQMLYSNHIGNLTGMVLRSATAGVFFKRLGHEDYVFWLEITRNVNRVVRVTSDQPLCFYTVRNSSISANKVVAAGWQWRIYRKVLGLNLVQSTFYFCGYVLSALSKRRA